MIKIVVPVSGGKDSQACLKLTLESYDKSEVIGLFCDTQFEHPLTYQHIDFMRDFYGVEIYTTSAGSVEDKVKKYKRFPGGARHCTDELKINPSKIFYKELAEEHGGFEVWYGMRSGESHDRKKRYQDKISNDLYAPNDVLAKYPKYLYKLGVKFRLPILEWSEDDVFEYVGEKELNPLYAQGFARVGCFPCLASGDNWKEKAFYFDETGRKHYKLVKELEQFTNHSVWTSKSGMARNNERQNDIFNGCAFCAI